MIGFTVAMLRKLRPAGKKVLFGLLKFGLREVIHSVPVVGSATRLFEEVAQFGVDRLADVGISIPGVKAAGDFFPPDQIAAVERWVGSIGDTCDALREKLEASLRIADDAPWEDVAANVEKALEQNADLAREFAKQQQALEYQTLSLHRIERQLSDLFHVQKGVSGSLEEIKAALLNHPSAADYAEFRRGDPEGRRMLNEADDLILAGRRAEGEKKMIELLRRRGIGTTVIAREYGLHKFAAGDVPAAVAAWNEAGDVAAIPPQVTSFLSRQTTRPSQPAGQGWLSLPRGLVIGGKVRVEDEVGRGGMASVYRAIGVDGLNNGKEFALKVPAPGLVVGDETDRFLREIELSRQLSESARHVAKFNPKQAPPLVQMHDYLVFDDPVSGQKRYGLVLDFVQGRTLESFLAVRQARKQRLTADEIRRLVRPVCNALLFAHNHKPQVLHRDVKAANILISSAGKVLLTDFGIARVLDDSRQGSTKSGSIVGTLVNMPPEMYLQGAVLDERVDVYMVGKLLLELLTFSLQGDPESRPDCPAAWVDLIADATNHVRGKRPRTIQAFLNRFLEREPPSAPPAPAPAPKKELQAGSIFTNSLSMIFAWIPPGKFQMGSPKHEDKRSDDETQHWVTLTRGFYIGAYPVTQAEWHAVMGSNPSSFKGDDRPVESVSWEDCKEFCRQMSERDGRQYRLPTEAEWEYACRAGTQTPFHFGKELNGTQANCDGNYPYGTNRKGPHLQQTSAVGSYPPNAFGLYDMHGTVWEWCADLYAHYPEGEIKDPFNGKSGDARVLRGGSWDNNAGRCRAANRNWYAPGFRSCIIGLRICFRLD